MLDYDFEQSIGFWMIGAAHAYQKAVTDEISPQGITFRQAQVLGFLALERALSQAELAERMGIEPPTLVGILDRMERDGWIRRDACEGDKRKKLVSPMPEAKPIWSQIVAAARRVRARATRGLSDAQLATLRELLGKVKDNLDAPDVIHEETP